MIFVDTWAWVALACKRDQHHVLHVGLGFRLVP